VQQQQQQMGRCGLVPNCDQALLSLKEAVQHLQQQQQTSHLPLLQQQQQQQQQYETIRTADADAAASSSSSSSSLWCDLAEDIPNMLRAESLQQLEAVLGPEGKKAIKALRMLVILESCMMHPASAVTCSS
jgi:hypothetical protein